jgi:predicted O-methyltransferase YrrM
LDCQLDPTATHLPILRDLLKCGGIKTVLEFGCGMYSTKAFLDAGCELTSIEMQSESWFSLAQSLYPGHDIRLALGAYEWQTLDLKPRYDLIFVDGHGDSRPDCMEWAKYHTDLIVAHDTEHPYYKWDRADMSGFNKEVFSAVIPHTTVWTRRHIFKDMDGVGQWQSA